MLDGRLKSSWVSCAAVVALLSTGCGSSLSDAQRWALAAPGIIKVVNEMDLDVMGGGTGDDMVQALQEMLRRDWEVRDAASARQAIADLLKEGHRKDYEKIMAQVAPLDEAAFNQLLAEGQGSPDTVEAYRLVRRHIKDPRGKSILAWDYCRVIYLAECSARAGYLPEEEAWKTILPAARTLQTSFGSWEEMGDNYLLGREFWGGPNEPEVLEARSKVQSGPWRRIPWNQPLDQ